MIQVKRLIVLLALAFTLALVPAGTAQAKKPLIGAMDLEYNLGWPEPQDVIPDWAGTITINETEYGMLFFCIGSGKAFDTPPLRGKIHFFAEIWAIYDTGFDFTSLLPSDDPDDWDGWLPSDDPDELVLWGYDEGQTNTQNNDYHMNGIVEEADGVFEDWDGRNVHMSGSIEWQVLETPEGPVVAPEHAPGIFRIN